MRLWECRSNKIKLDFDDIDVSGLSALQEHVKDVCKFLGLNEYVGHTLIKKSKSGKGFHIEILLTQYIYNWQILVIQALCNSDWKRECFNLQRLTSVECDKDDDIKWNVLFRS